MKSNFGLRTLGLFFIIFSLLGILFSIAGIAATWIFKPNIQNSLFVGLATFEEILTTTGDALNVMDSTIENAKDDLDVIESSLGGLETTFDSISASLHISATLIGDDLRSIVVDSQDALDSASSAAELIDMTLTFISKIPLIGVEYEPKVPLNISLSQISSSLDVVPDYLETIEINLKDTTGGLDVLNSEFSALSSNITALDKDLEDAQKVLNDYNAIVEDIEEQISKLKRNLPAYLITFSVFITGIFFWLALTQTSLFLQGYTYLKGPQQIVNVGDLRRDAEQQSTNKTKD